MVQSVSAKNFTLLPRVEYFDFMKILGVAQFVITDGVSNQEELAYKGKPYLIMRTATEHQDGLGVNAVLCNNNFNSFIKNYNNDKTEPITILYGILEKPWI